MRNVQPQIFADDLYLNAPKQIMGNLRSSQSVPSIQFQPFQPFGQNQSNIRPPDNTQSSFNQFADNQMPLIPQALQVQYQQQIQMQQTQPMQPLQQMPPRQRTQPPIPPPPAPSQNTKIERLSNHDLFFSFNDPFFDEKILMFHLKFYFN